MKLFLCALGILALTSTAFAEEVTRKEGDKSLNFSLSRTELQQYKYGFGGKYWLSPDTAFSGSLDLSDDEQSSSATLDGSSSTMNSTYYALSLALEKHFQTSSRLSPYIGGELKYSRSQSIYDTDYTTGSYNNETLAKQYGAGLLAGAEYALNKNISLAGEYSYGFSYRVSKYYSTGSYQTTRLRGFDLSVGRLTLLLYF